MEDKYAWEGIRLGGSATIDFVTTIGGPYVILPPSYHICRFYFPCHKFDSIYRKYEQHLSSNKFIKKLDSKIFSMIPIMYHKY
jgi:hypothetical protein